LVGVVTVGDRDDAYTCVGQALQTTLRARQQHNCSVCLAGLTNDRRQIRNWLAADPATDLFVDRLPVPGCYMLVFCEASVMLSAHCLPDMSLTLFGCQVRQARAAAEVLPDARPNRSDERPAHDDPVQVETYDGSVVATVRLGGSHP